MGDNNLSNIKCKILGVDPGQTGAVSYVERDETGEIIYVRIIDCITHASGRQWSLDTEKMLSGMRMWPVAYLAVMENQILKTGKGIQTMYINFGLLLGAVERCAHRIDFVTSREWKSFYKLSKNKDESIEKVFELYPDYVSLLMRPGGRKPSADRAESLLLADFAYQTIWLKEQANKSGMLL